MGSTFSGINSMTRGLSAHQISLNTTGHNITNANTTGFSRQRVDLSASNPDNISGSYGKIQVGTGVSIEAVNRMRDAFIDRQIWRSSSTVGYDTMQDDSMKKIEQIFNEPSDTGLKNILDQFSQSLQTLSTDASNLSTRASVAQRGVQVANRIEQLNTALLNNIDDANNNIIINVDKLNQLTKDISDLNKNIFKIENGSKNSTNANDIRDRRDLLVDQLSSLVSVDVVEGTNGMYKIFSNGNTLVDYNTSYNVSTTITQDADFNYDVVNLEIGGSSFNGGLGELSGAVNARDSLQTGTKNYLNQITTIAKFFLKDFNNIHKSGYGLNNETNNNFFGNNINYNTVTFTNKDWLDNFKVNTDILSTDGYSLIAAKTSNTQGNASGDNVIKLEQSMKTNLNSVITNGSLNSFYDSLIGTLGIQSQNANSSLSNSSVILNQVKTVRESLSGVNLDEEMANMIKFQQGYNASARMLTTMDELLDKLINSTGVVGR